MSVLITTILTNAFLFGPKSIPLEKSGKRVSLFGKGPPVVFSSGLFGLMPRRLYGDLFKKMTKDVTFVVLNDVAPVTSDIVDDIADTLAVERVGFFSHSSIDGNILKNDRVHMAVICDPVMIPSVEMPTMQGMEFKSPSIDNKFPVLVIKAEKAYDPSVSTPIPEFLGPRFENEQREIIATDVGHADLLDDFWAELGTKLIPFMKGVVSKVVPFSDWSPVKNENNAKAIRAVYRTNVATWSLEHILRSEKSLTNNTFIDV
jgi:hypothetical protein